MQVSICCLTYNHEKFIRQTLDGFLMQKNVASEILINDDASTDQTPGILREYAAKYPEITGAVFQPENIFTKTGQYPNLAEILYSRAEGKYIALCDGDDFWTDPYKLQKQVEFMDQHPECVMCHHDYLILENGKYREPDSERPRDFTQEELIGFSLAGYGIGTCTKMFRNLYNEHKEDFEAFYCDYPLNVLMGTLGECKYVPGIEPSVYRREHGGSWSGMDPKERHKRTMTMFARVYELIEAKSNPQWTELRRRFL